MKKLLSVIMCLVLVISLCACSSEQDDMVKEAIEEIRDYYEDEICDDIENGSPYLKICSTRIITLKKSFTGDIAEEAEELLEDVEYLVEFQTYVCVKISYMDSRYLQC